MTDTREIILIAHNLRSCHNVGSLLRTAEGLGISKACLTGYTPYPITKNDKRIPHEARKLHKQINKTALGAEDTMNWEHDLDIFGLINNLHRNGFQIYALEQNKDSIKLPAFEPPDKIAIIVGREVEGIESEVISAIDECIEIPMFGSKESFNVVQAAAMALYHCTFA